MLPTPGPPDSALLPHGCHTPMPCHTPHLKGAVGTARWRPNSRLPTAPSPCRVPTARRQLPRHAHHRPPLSASDRACLTRHTTDADRPHPSPPRRSPPSRSCRATDYLAVRTLPSLTSPVSRGAVAFVTPPCRTHATVYTVSSHYSTGRAPVRPRRAFPLPPPMRR
jgi:hypothetical protein